MRTSTYFCIPGAEDLQTVQESVPQRTILAVLAAKADLMAGFTAERDMGTEGAGSADTAVRNAIDQGLVPGPRLRISGNAVDILGGHEDAIGYNPAQHVLPNATWANNAAELVTVIRGQFKEGADFIKIYETGRDALARWHVLHAISIHRSRAARRRGGSRARGKARGRARYRRAGHALCRARRRGFCRSCLPAQRRNHAHHARETDLRRAHFCHHRILRRPRAHPRGRPTASAACSNSTRANSASNLAAGVPMAMGSDVGPFPHGTQAREFVLMVKYGMTPLAAIQAGTLNGARLLGWQDQIGALKPGYFADIVAVPGDPLQDIGVLQKVTFVMKGGVVYKR